MKLRIVVAALALAVVVGALTAYVALTAGSELLAAKGALAGAPQDLGEDALSGARAHVERAVDHLDSLPARALGLVPVARQNIAAVRAVAEATLPVLDSGLELDRRLDIVQRRGLVEDGAVRLDLVAEAEPPLRAEARALEHLERDIERHRSGWLLPPLWSQLDEQLGRTRTLQNSAERAADAARIAPAMLGADGSRRYLVLMLNNAELRGAGGILSGVGTLTTAEGEIEVGDFEYYKDLADDPPYRKVPAPEDFAEHFGRYHADTTRWLATSSTPDVPDAALVAARLYRLVTGVDTDGALVVDARGLTALMPRGARVAVPGTDTMLERDDLAPFVYSRAYEQLEGQSARRDALIALGNVALESVLERGLGDKRSWAGVGEAVAGGHLRFVSFDPSEEAALESLGVSGELGTPASDGSLVTVQNFGGNKLDYWARRDVRHACDLGDGDVAECATGVGISNRAPEGLPRFVYQYRPYGLFKNYVEVYVPHDADITGVDLDGGAARFFEKREDGYTAVGVYAEVPRGERAEVEVRYRLPLGPDGYSLEALPQPQTHDGDLSVALTVPARWTTEGPGTVSDGMLRHRGTFDEALRWRVHPSDRTGIPALWAGVVNFWREPLFYGSPRAHPF
ncbi:MAG: DUF4012 domain-containing protein [Actinomycetota bacterium]